MQIVTSQVVIHMHKRWHYRFEFRSLDRRAEQPWLQLVTQNAMRRIRRCSAIFESERTLIVESLFHLPFTCCQRWDFARGYLYLQEWYFLILLIKIKWLSGMPRRCKVGGCSVEAGHGVPLHRWPADVNIAARWNCFVKLTRADHFTLAPASTHICCLHFLPSDYDNLFAFRNKGAKLLGLCQGAVPTVKDGQTGPMVKELGIDVTEAGRSH